MVATLVRLRATLLRHTLQQEVWRLLLLVIGVLWALLALPSLVGGMAWLRDQPVEVTHDVLVVGGTLLLVGWAVVPLVVPGLDDSLDVQRFATSGVAPRRLVPGLLVASLLGVPTAFTGLVCLAPVLAWSGTGRRAVVLLAAVMGLTLLVTCVAAARVSTGLLTRVLGARRARETSAVVGVLATVGAVAVVVGIGRLGVEGVLEHVPAVAGVLAWTPFGAAWAAPAALAAGDLPGSLARAGVAVVSAVLLCAAWARLMQAALVRPPARSGRARRRSDAFVDRAPRSEGRPGVVVARAVLRRALRYWATDPRYVSAMLGSVLLPVLVVLLAATVIDAPAAVALSMAPLLAGTIGWGRHNDVAYDGSAFWLHVAARVPGWADRAGRTVGTLVWAVPVVVVVGVAGAVVGGRPALAPASVGAGLGVLAAGLAVSAVASAVLTYPVPAAGGNPYAVEAGALGASLVAQLVTSAGTAVLCLPVLAAYGVALWRTPAFGWVTLVVGLVGGAVCLVVGVVLGGRVYDARAVRLLSRLT